MKTIFAIITAVIITGCVAPTFNPTTQVGAECKKSCASGMQSCNGSSYTCDKSYAACISACIDTERLSK